MSDFLPDPAEAIEVTPQAVAAWLQLPADERPRLIDCREQEEWDIVSIAGAELLPIHEIPGCVEELSGSPHGIVIHCHHGMRSLRATQFLRAHGIDNVFSMSGGIAAWADEIEPEMARY